VQFVIPGQSEPLRTRFSTWHGPQAKVLSTAGHSVRDVYADERRSAFETFVKRYLGVLVSSPPSEMARVASIN
jgi:hypothetical protein